MLRQLRDKKTAKKIWIILAIIILPAFVLWGSGSIIKNKGEPGYVGRIFGKRITLMQYKDALDATRNQMIMQYGEDLAEIQKNVNLESMAWERILLLSEADKRKIKTEDKEVIGQIQTYPFFQRKGKFDNAIYAQMMQYVFRTQSRIFEEQTRENLRLLKLFKDVTREVKLTEKEIADSYRKNNEEISLYYITSQYNDFKKEINPFEGGLRDYFSKNALKFKQPLSFNLEYIQLTTEGQEENIVREKAKKIAARLNKNSELIKIAKEFGLTSKETGFFGQADAIPGIGWSPEILALVSKAKVKDILPFIYTDKSYCILKLKE
ncbi:MAG: SurA N-terminal domain-containing protein, partial [bacterium]